MNTHKFVCSLCTTALMLAATGQPIWAQAAPEKDAARIRQKLAELQKAVAELKQADADTRLVADVEIYAKAAEWILRHNEFYRPQYVDQTSKALASGLRRARELAAGKPSWTHAPGTTIRGYYSKVDGSVQPYALTLPKGVDPTSLKRWPLHVRLHGRAAQMNEVNFIHRHDGKPLPEGQDWIGLDVFGRTNNAYRYSGETDVFEAIADAGRTARIDSRRMTLWGFSMGGAGAWHLGLHHPSKWSSVGPGAGFIDFYKYQKQTEKRPEYQHKTLRIYDSVDYALNAFDVPVCTYGGENDAQLIASTIMVEKAKQLGASIKLLVGPGVGHKFHPDSFREFMAFHQKHSQRGRKPYPGLTEIRFVTHTLKYNKCEWLTIEEMAEMYEPAVVLGKIDPRSGMLKLQTENVAVLQIARGIAERIEIDGSREPLANAADGLLPGVYYEKQGDDWLVMDYDSSRAFAANPDVRKRHNLQGPIDDAFMEPFVCVRGTGQPWSETHAAWADWTLDRFRREFDKWLRGRVLIVNDADVTKEMIARKNLILFGDPGSNSVLAKILDRLPIKWEKGTLAVGGKKYDPQTHGLSMIYPNPLAPRRYVVINSGHTFHEKDFKASNSWLFPRLGDIAVQRFGRLPDGGYEETVVWADLFDASWRLPGRGNTHSNP